MPGRKHHALSSISYMPQAGGVEYQSRQVRFSPKASRSPWSSHQVQQESQRNEQCEGRTRMPAAQYSAIWCRDCANAPGNTRSQQSMSLPVGHSLQEHKKSALNQNSVSTSSRTDIYTTFIAFLSRSIQHPTAQ
jgi:hypothetical protein